MDFSLNQQEEMLKKSARDFLSAECPSDLVREMAEQVQFIFITHNKVTMEIANQLSGVTMHEPGVSRLVSVDVEEAAALAAV